MSRLTLWAWPCGLAAKKLLWTSMDLDLIATMLQTMYNVTHLYFYNLSISLLSTSMDLILMATVLQTMYSHIFILYDWFDIHYLLLYVFLSFSLYNGNGGNTVQSYILKPKSKFDDAIHSNNLPLYLFVLLKSSRAFWQLMWKCSTYFWIVVTVVDGTCDVSEY